MLCKLFLSCLQSDPRLLREAGAGLIATGVYGEEKKIPGQERWWWQEPTVLAVVLSCLVSYSSLITLVFLDH